MRSALFAASLASVLTGPLWALQAPAIETQAQTVSQDTPCSPTRPWDGGLIYEIPRQGFPKGN